MMYEQVNSPKRVFICQTTTELKISNLLSATEAELIYYKKYGTGFLVLLKFSAKKEKRHSTVENSIISLDKTLMRGFGTDATSFVSVSDVGSGKVRSFTSTDRIRDELFREIFDVNLPKQGGEYCLREGVKKWDLSTSREEDLARDSLRETEDLLVQQQVMEEDPEAFGGNSSLGLGSKMMDRSSSVLDDEGGTVVNEVCQEIESLKIALASAEEALAAKDALENGLLAAETALATMTTTTKDLKRAKIAAEVALAKERARADQASSELQEAILVRNAVLVSKLEADTSLRAAETALMEHAAKMKAVLKQKDDKIASLKAACKAKVGGKGEGESRRCAKLQKRVGVLEAEYGELKTQLAAERASVAVAFDASGDGDAVVDAQRENLRQRLKRALADKEEAITQRDKVVLAKLELEQQLQATHATIAKFPHDLNEALGRKHRQYEMDGMAQVRSEVARMKTQFERERDATLQTEMARMKKHFEGERDAIKKRLEGERDAMVLAEAAKLKNAETLKRQWVQLETRVAELTKRGVETDARCVTLQERADELEREHGVLKAQLETARAQCVADMGALKAQCEQQEAEKDDLEEELERVQLDAEAQIKALEAEIVRLKEEVQKAQLSGGGGARVVVGGDNFRERGAQKPTPTIESLTAQVQKLREERGSALREVQDLRFKLRQMQKRRIEGKGMAGEEDIIDPVEDEEAMMSITEKLRLDLLYAKRLMDGEVAERLQLERILETERREKVQEMGVLRATIEAKDREAKELEAAAMSDAVVRERWGVLPKFQEVLAEYDARKAAVEAQLETQSKAFGERLQDMHRDSMRAEAQWRHERDVLEETKDDLEEELEMMRLRLSVEGEKMKPTTAGVGEEAEEEAVPTVPLDQFDRLRLRAEQAEHNATEAVKTLEAEQAKVQALLARLDLGVDAAAGQRIEAERQHAEAAQRVATEQAQRAGRLEQEAKAAKDELAKRLDAGQAMLGEVYRSYEEQRKETRLLQQRLTKAERLRQEAMVRAEEALKAEHRAQVEVVALRKKRGGEAAEEDDEEASDTLDSKLRAETALRCEAEAKLAKLTVQRRADQARLVQLKSELREADARAEEMSSRMRGGPFAGY